MKNKKCFEGGMKHNFKPRYDEAESNINVTRSRGIPVNNLRKLLIKKIYIKDICTWCGKEIQKRT